MNQSTKWQLCFSHIAQKELRKLDPAIVRKIIKFFEAKILTVEDPRLFAKPLTGNLYQFWRFRIENYRVVCEIESSRLTIHILHIGHRRHIYEFHH